MYLLHNYSTKINSMKIKHTSIKIINFIYNIVSVSNILVASTNPNKLQGTKQAFETFPEIFKEVDVKGEKVKKVVPALPIGFKQTLKGSKNTSRIFI